MYRCPLNCATSPTVRISQTKSENAAGKSDLRFIPYTRAYRLWSMMNTAAYLKPLKLGTSKGMMSE
jgi:hypothetical protein